MVKHKKRSAVRSRTVVHDPGPNRRRWWWVLLAAMALCGAGFTVWAVGRETLSLYGVQVVRRYPHDPRAYCQGLVFADGMLYEGTGLYGESSLRKVDLQSGRPLQIVPLPPQFFGEGIAIWKDKIIQLTWQENEAIVYDRRTLRESHRFRYTGEGWGLTHDGKHLIMSDGRPTLRFLDAEAAVERGRYRVVKRLTVRSGRHRIKDLNELEYIRGEIFANVWKKDYILRISPRSGEVIGKIDLRNLWPRNRRPSQDAVLNGIAYDAANDRLFVTGKHWPSLFEIRLTRQSAAR